MADTTTTVPMGPETQSEARDDETSIASLVEAVHEPGKVSDNAVAAGDEVNGKQEQEQGQETEETASLTAGIAAATVPTWDFSKITTTADVATEAPAPIFSASRIMSVVDIEPTGSPCVLATSPNTGIDSEGASGSKADMGLPVIWTVDGTLATLDTPVDKFLNWADYVHICRAGPQVVIRFREEYTETVELASGPVTRVHERHHGFPVSKKLLTEQTDYFAGMFRAGLNWVENQTGTAEYDRNDPLGHPAAFKTLYQMLVVGGMIEPFGGGRDAVTLYILAEMHYMADYLGCRRCTDWIQTWADRALSDHTNYWKVVSRHAHPALAAHLSAICAADLTNRGLQKSMLEDALATQAFVLEHARSNYVPVFRASKVAEMLVAECPKDQLDEQVKQGGLSASAMAQLFLMERRKNGQGH